MYRLTIIAIGLVWASLMLISWGGAEDLHTPVETTSITGSTNF